MISATKQLFVSETSTLSNATGCIDAPTTAGPCARCDLLLGLDGVHVEAVERDEHQISVTVSSPWRLMGCPTCGVVAPSRGRRLRVLHDVPSRRARPAIVACSRRS